MLLTVLRGFALLLVLSLWVLSRHPAMAADRMGPAPIVAAFNDAPPMAYTNAKGNLDGALYRVSRSLFAVAGLPWQGWAYPAPRLIKGMQDGSFNFSMLVPMPALAECCLYSSRPVIVQEPTLYFLKGKEKLRSKEEMNGHSLIVVNGFTYAGMIGYFRDPAHHIQVEVAETLDSAFRMLAAGRADYLLSYEANARSVLAAHPINDLDSSVIGRIPVYMVLSRNYPEAGKTMARLEEVVQAMNIHAIMAEE